MLVHGARLRPKRRHARLATKCITPGQGNEGKSICRTQTWHKLSTVKSLAAAQVLNEPHEHDRCLEPHSQPENVMRPHVSSKATNKQFPTAYLQPLHITLSLEVEKHRSLDTQQP